ncbi:MAG: hypothetical protein KF751_07325 [Nitrospira sp.]|nr:hypothetical protein [Nitrospira sp.]MBX3349040.1 hypothetical protein [Nitrospira sp.]
MLGKVLTAIVVLSFTVPIMGLASHALALNITLSKAKPNTVSCDVVVTETGDIDTNTLSVSCKVAPPSEGLPDIPGLALCRNPGSKKNAAPGIQLVEVGLVGSFEDTSEVAQVNCNGETGRCEQIVTAAAKGAQLAALNAACPNPRWTVTDFAPCSTMITVTATGTCSEEYEGYEGNRTRTVTKTYTCIQNNCQAVQFDKKTGSLGGPDYSCTEVSNTDSGCVYPD